MPLYKLCQKPRSNHLGMAITWNNNPKDLFPTAVPWDDHPKVLADKAMVSDALIVNAPNPFVCDNHSVGQQVVHAGKTDKLCKLFHRLDACRFRGVHCA
jgi:hypothetical protein